MSKAAPTIIAEDFGWDDEVFLSFLPASHAYEHSGGQIFPIGLGAQIYYSEGLEKLASNIEEVRPTIMVVVPRLFEVLRQRILKQVEKQGRLDQLSDEPGARASAPRTMRARCRCWDRPMDLFLGAHAAAQDQQPASAGGSRRWCRAARRSIPEVGIFFHSLGPHPAPGLRPDRGGAGDQLQPAERRASRWTRSGRR